MSGKSIHECTAEDLGISPDLLASAQHTARLLEEAADAERSRWFEPFLVDVPEGTKGKYTIERFEVQPNSFEMIHHTMNGRYIVPGTYTKLTRNGSRGAARATCVMSDAPAEIADHLPFVENAGGNVLVFGLGVGMVTKALLEFQPKVETVTVVELEQDVIDLVAPHYQKKYGDRFGCIQGNAYSYVPEMVYDCCWLDIWDNISKKNLGNFAQLRRNLKMFVDGSIMAWAEELCIAQKFHWTPAEKERVEGWLAERKRLTQKWTDIALARRK